MGHWVPCRGALGVMSWRTRRCVVAPLRPCCRRPLSCCRTHARAVALCRSSLVAIQKLYRSIEGPCRTHCEPCRTLCHAQGAVLQALLSCHSAVFPPPFMIQNFVSRHTAAKTRACAPLASTRRPVMSWPLTGHVMGRCWPCRGALLVV